MTTQGIKSLESSVKQPTRDRTGDLDDVLRVIYESISDLNLQLAEQKLEESYGFRVDLTEDDPFSPTTGHFRTVESLATYVTSLAARRPDSA
jgi:hypothetical protein